MVDPYCEYYEEDDDIRTCQLRPGLLLSCEGCTRFTGSGAKQSVRMNHRSKKLDGMLGKKVRITTRTNVHEGVLQHAGGWYYMKPSIWTHPNGRKEPVAAFRFRKTHVQKAEVIRDDKVQ